MSRTPLAPIDERTIADFGRQWTAYPDNSGYYGSTDLFEDAFGALLPREEIRGRRVADIGSGSGRIVLMLLALGADEVIAVEPSSAFEVLQAQTRQHAGRIRYIRDTGDRLPPTGDLDLVVTYGVLHHIYDPKPVMNACFRALKPGGRMIAWLYGWEGNAAYLRCAIPLRRVTTHLPHRALDLLSRLLNLGVDLYLPLARRLPVPLAGYMTRVFGKLSRQHRSMVIYDQLCPAYARYYKHAEARALFEDAGFRDVRLHHRHGYSWTVIGTRPVSP
jgi:SAM-dependent methyltransferase